MSSFSIFGWNFFYMTGLKNNILSYCKGPDCFDDPEISFNVGHSATDSETKGVAVVTYPSVSYYRQTTNMLPIGVWTFVGVVFDSSTGVLSFYANGDKIEDVGPNLQTNMILTDLDTIYLGKFLDGTKCWTPRANVEMYLKAFSVADAASVYQDALNNRGGTDC